MGQKAADAAKPEAAASAQQPPLALAQQPLAQQIAALLADPAIARAHSGVVVTTLDGRPIYSLNEAQLSDPTATPSLLTAAAMGLLPPSHVFVTTVTGTGLFMEDGTLRGVLL